MNYWLNSLTDQSTLYDCMVVWVSDWLIIINNLFDSKDDWLTTHRNTLQKTALLAKWISGSGLTVVCETKWSETKRNEMETTVSRNSVQNQTPVFIHLSGQDSRTMGIKWKNSDQVSTMLRRQCQITTLGAHTNKDYSSRGLFNNINFAIIIFSHFDIHKIQSATYIERLLYLALFYLTVGWGKIEC